MAGVAKSNPNDYANRTMRLQTPLAERYTELADARRRAGDAAGALAPLRRAMALRALAKDRRLVDDARRALAAARAKRAAPRLSPRS